MSDTALQEYEAPQAPDNAEVSQALDRASQMLQPLTPAQARVESVARVMDAAMNKASTLILTPEENAGLEADFPDEAFKPGAAGKEHLIYIEHAHLRDRFNQVIGRGQWAILRTRPHWAEEYRTANGKEAVRLYADCVLLVRGCMVAEAIGDMSYFKSNDSQNYGDAAEGAVTAAFRRCAKNFGVGLQAWKKDFCEGWWQRRKGNKAESAPKALQQPMPQMKPTQVPLVPAPMPAVSFKSDKERQARLDAHLLKCKLKLVSDLEKGDPQAAIEFAQKAGHLMPNESALSEANELSLFPSVPHSPAQHETDGEWWALVQEAVAKDALTIKRAFETFQAGGEPPEDDGDLEPVPDGCNYLKIDVVAVSVKNGSSKKGPWTLYGVKDENDHYYNTFSDTVGKKAEALKGHKATVFYTEDDRGYKLHKIIPA